MAATNEPDATNDKEKVKKNISPACPVLAAFVLPGPAGVAVLFFPGFVVRVAVRWLPRVSCRRRHAGKGGGEALILLLLLGGWAAMLFSSTFFSLFFFEKPE